MGELVMLPRHNRIGSAVSGPVEAEILLFTGVRYERYDDSDDQPSPHGARPDQRPTPGPKRKRG